ncbi:hypothetical protein GUITHDRAFT_121899 [Guillardia theta CCMP2712]|uniref:Uncharacterized protein n=1 Tax=Guillardia theta (strain CCMP2712) TaxID=905079 RepID=L1I779_GUITC|nr:hypothetical protein GUITHDRAFT_121899 [Guillardia theta CCMP2712]EKX31927.1 hypothetical protein GUITHDRAFT_121899 [Guillardia theta CCMP2712]|eukprot:XP_005818907.1 hypothetical protein GUITHDRAFT_121899 [Guillardia theta CCMP2712]
MHPDQYHDNCQWCGKPKEDHIGERSFARLGNWITMASANGVEYPRKITLTFGMHPDQYHDNCQWCGKPKEDHIGEKKFCPTWELDNDGICKRCGIPEEDHIGDKTFCPVKPIIPLEIG